MDNFIRRVAVIDKRLDPTEAEIHVAVYPAQLTAGTEVKGRFLGPSCPYAATIEVAYHLREVARAADHILLRAIVPEPCLWDLQSPFLYRAPLELWQDGARCVQTSLSHGLCQLRLMPHGVRVNGREVHLRGTSRLPATETQARALHERGFNLLLTPAAADAGELADRFGFLVLARAPAARTSHAHLSMLGLILPSLDVEPPSSVVPDRLGIELVALPPGPLPGWVEFVVCDRRALPALAAVALPMFVLTDEAASLDRPAPPGVVAWILF